MTTSVLHAHVAAYAAQVRAHLADLSAEQVEDLTDGLEADLSEALDDPEARPVTGEIPLPRTGGAPATAAAASATASATRSGTSPGTPTSTTVPDAGTSLDDLTERFGTPQAYAEELRSAAGLPAPVLDDGVAPARPRLAVRVRDRFLARRASLVARPWWPAARATGEALRPLWWVARGWVLYNLVVTMVSGTANVSFVPDNLFGIILLLAVVAASVQHGQGRWTLSGKGHHVLTAVSVLAAVALLPTLMTATARSNQVDYVTYGYQETPPPVADGVYLGGRQVTNLFVYDAEGAFVDQAQIVDETGRAVRVDREGGLWDETTGQSRYWSPAHDAYGRDVWNAFPLRMWSDKDAEWDDTSQTWVLRPTVTPSTVPPPVAQLAPLELDAAGEASEEEGAVVQPDSATPAPPAVDPAAPADPADPAAPTPSEGVATPDAG